MLKTLLEFNIRTVVGAMHRMTAEHFVHRPPGTYVNLPMLLIALTMLYLSTRAPRDVGVAAMSES